MGKNPYFRLMHPLEASLLFVSSSGSFSMMMVAQREDPPSTSFLRYASSCGRNPPPISFCVCTLALDWRKILQSGFAVTPREFFCLSRWLGAYAFYPQHIAFEPLVQRGSFPQGAAAFIADKIMLEGKQFWLLLLLALGLVYFILVCERRKLEQRSPPPPVLLVSMLALVFVEGIN